LGKIETTFAITFRKQNKCARVTQSPLSVPKNNNYPGIVHAYIHIMVMTITRLSGFTGVVEWNG